MTNGLTSPKATERPPGPMPQAARGAPPPRDAFAGMLDAHQARTAIAEGQDKSPEQGPSRAERERGEKCAAPAPVESKPVEENSQPATGAEVDQDPNGEAPADDTASAVAPSVLAAVTLPVATATPVAATATPVAATATSVATVAVVAGAPSSPVVQVVTPAAAQAAPAAATAVPVASTAATAPVTSAEASVPAASPAVASQAGATLGAEKAPALTTTDGQVPTASKPVVPSAGGGGSGKTGGETAGQPGTAQQQPGSQPSANVQAAATSATYSRPADPQQPQAAASQPAQAPAAVTAPATAAAPAEAPRPSVAAATPVPLSRAAEAVENVVRLAASRGGVTHARIALRPAELGSVDVHLRSTPEGLVARVVAHSAEAVQTLQHAAGDLRRSLEQQGLNLLTLDIGQSGERSAGRSDANAGELGHEKNGSSDSPTGDQAEDETTTKTTLRLPDGVLVDVLA